MGDAGKPSPHVSSTCAQNAILSLRIIYIIPSRQIYAVNDNPSCVRPVSCFTTISYHWTLRARSRGCFPLCKLTNQQLPVPFSLVHILGWDPRYLGFQVLWSASELTSTQPKLHPRSEA
jgi:hypothetical protein